MGGCARFGCVSTTTQLALLQETLATRLEISATLAFTEFLAASVGTLFTAALFCFGPRVVPDHLWIAGACFAAVYLPLFLTASILSRRLGHAARTTPLHALPYFRSMLKPDGRISRRVPLLRLPTFPGVTILGAIALYMMGYGDHPQTFALGLTMFLLMDTIYSEGQARVTRLMALEERLGATVSTALDALVTSAPQDSGFQFEFMKARLVEVRLPGKPVRSSRNPERVCELTR